VGLKFRLSRLKCYAVQKGEDMKLKMEIRTELNKPHEDLKHTTPHSLDTLRRTEKCEELLQKTKK
jgi:hypothetical protein